MCAMTTAAYELLTAVDALPDAERDRFVTELLLRHPTGGSDLPDSGREEIAEELFLSYDTAEGLCERKL
jgi:hypothetical protein